MSVDNDKQHVACLSNGIFCPQKEWYTDIQNYMVGPWKHYSKSQKPITKKTDILWLYLYEISRTASSLETEYRLVVVQGWGRWRTLELLLMSIFLLQWSKWSKIDYNDECITLNKIMIIELYIFNRWIISYMNYMHILHSQ